MKKLFALIIVLILSVGLIACGDDNKNDPPENNQNDISENNTEEALIEIDAEACAKYISENVTFQDFMEPIDDSIFLELYNIDPALVSDACAYLSTGATAEEIAVITVSDGDTEDKITSINGAFNNRVAAQKTAFENYVPAELNKLETPFIMEAGNTVILVVCDDSDTAKNVILDYID